MNRLFCLVLLLLTGWSAASAQALSGGFKAGLNFSTFNGPEELDNAGESVEQFSFNTGFHIGATFRLELNDFLGLRAELLYSQKGTAYDFDGQSYWIFFNGTNAIYSTGMRNTVLRITHSYLDLPLMAYLRLGRLEISAGPSVGLLLGARATGDLTYSGQTQSTNIEAFNLALDYNYFKDSYQGANTNETISRTIGSTTVSVPKNIGAYYQGVDSEDPLFNRLDLGLNAGLAFFLNKGLYLSLRLNYGLSDISNEAQDISLVRLDSNRSFIFREDLDRNLSLQISIGFSL